MKRQEGSPGWVVGAVLGGTALAGGLLIAAAAWPRVPHPSGGPAPQRPGETPDVPAWWDADVEAAARMLASEKVRGSQALHIELIHTQLRARKQGQSLFARITAGSGWGPQGERSPGGGVRPVSTAEPATPALRELARDVIAGLRPSTLPGARKFFEPAQMDRALVIADRARQKRVNGLPLTMQEKRLIHYRRAASDVRSDWLAGGAKHLGTIEGFEFYS